MREYMEVNRRKWDELVSIHTRPTSRYKLEDSRSGQSTLRSIELEEVGDVPGKSLLHLQCHFGLDSLARSSRTRNAAKLGRAALPASLQP